MVNSINTDQKSDLGLYCLHMLFVRNVGAQNLRTFCFLCSCFLKYLEWNGRVDPDQTTPEGAV